MKDYYGAIRLNLWHVKIVLYIQEPIRMRSASVPTTTWYDEADLNYMQKAMR